MWFVWIASDTLVKHIVISWQMWLLKINWIKKFAV